MTEIQAQLFALRDEAYQAFNARLLPTLPPQSILGVRTPELRRLAKAVWRSPECDNFMSTLPHTYFEENQLHAFLLDHIRDPQQALEQLEVFLPYVDNWATCDQLSPTCFSRDPAVLEDRIPRWLASEHTYTIRFGIGMKMRYFLDERFSPDDLEAVAALCSDEYYVNMMIAWYFATALAKQYEAALPYLEGRRLDRWTHNKAIQKAIESRSIPEEQKRALRSLKWKE